MTDPTAWRTLLGTHAVTRALGAGEIPSSLVRLDIADVPVPNKAFKRVVRDVEFDVAELALMTFLMARSRGVPLCLFPVVLFARNPLPYLVCRRGTGVVEPSDLEGRVVGVRSYTTTTAVWTRAILRDVYGLRAERVQWLTCEEGHVAGLSDPPHVSRDPAANLATRLTEGTIDAAILDPVPAAVGVGPVVSETDGVWREWQRTTGAETVNHMLVVRESLAHDEAAMRELWRLCRASAAAARDDGAAPASVETAMSINAHRRSLEVAIDVATREGLLARPLTVDELTTATITSLSESL